jgi:peptidase E
VALGGGGFTEEPDNPALDDYVLAASGRARPRVCFLATAGGDSLSYTVKFYKSFSGGHCEPTHLAQFNRTVDDARALQLAQDVIFGGGGNTVNLLAVWQRRAYRVGVAGAAHRGARAPDPDRWRGRDARGRAETAGRRWRPGGPGRGPLRDRATSGGR